MQTFPCEWPFADLPCLFEQHASEGQREAAESAAKSWLWNWTHRRYGICTTTLTPVSKGSYEASTWRGRSDQRVRSSRSSLYGTTHVPDGLPIRRSQYGPGTALTLPGPIVEVDEVLLEGEPLPASAYRVDNRRILVRTDGGRWPVVVDLTSPSFEVTYKRGVAVPAGGQIAAAFLYCELLKAMVGSSDCQLPKRVTSLVRDGVTLGFLDTMEGLWEGRTGLYVVDSWLAEVNALSRRPAVFSPDLMPPRRMVP